MGCLRQHPRLRPCHVQVCCLQVDRHYPDDRALERAGAHAPQQRLSSGTAEQMMQTPPH